MQVGARHGAACRPTARAHQRAPDCRRPAVARRSPAPVAAAAAAAAAARAPSPAPATRRRAPARLSTSALPPAVAAAGAAAAAAAASAASAASAAAGGAGGCSATAACWTGLPPAAHDAACFFLAAVGGYAWVKIFDLLAASGRLDRKLSRKLVHATAGPLLVLTWPLFSASPAARLVAAAVPALNALRLALVGGGAVRDAGLVASVSRQGGRGELLRGPYYYVVVLSGLTAAFWRDHPAPALVAVAMMCGGDGLADIIGRRLGAGNPLPWNGDKSWAGSAAMAAGGMGAAVVMFGAFQAAGWDVIGVGGAAGAAGAAGAGAGAGGEAAAAASAAAAATATATAAAAAALVPRLLAICLACTAVESLPANRFVDDNLSVPAVAVIGSLLLLPAPAGLAAAGAGGGGGGGLVALALAAAGVAAAVGAAGAVAAATVAEDDEDDGAGGGVEAVSSSAQ